MTGRAAPAGRHVQDNGTAKAASAPNRPVTRGGLRGKGRFGHPYAENRG